MEMHVSEFEITDLDYQSLVSWNRPCSGINVHQEPAFPRDLLPRPEHTCGRDRGIVFLRKPHYVLLLTKHKLPQ